MTSYVVRLSMFFVSVDRKRLVYLVTLESKQVLVEQVKFESEKTVQEVYRVVDMDLAVVQRVLTLDVESMGAQEVCQVESAEIVEIVGADVVQSEEEKVWSKKLGSLVSIDCRSIVAGCEQMWEWNSKAKIVIFGVEV